MKKAIKNLQTTILAVVTLFVFVSVIRMIYAMFTDCNLISEYVSAAILTTFIMGLMYAVVMLLIESKKEA